MTRSLEVRPFRSSREFERMVDYFLDAGDEFLEHEIGCDEWFARRPDSGSA